MFLELSGTGEREEETRLLKVGRILVGKGAVGTFGRDARAHSGM